MKPCLTDGKCPPSERVSHLMEGTQISLEDSGCNQTGELHQTHFGFNLSG